MTSNVQSIRLEDAENHLLSPNIWILKRIGFILPETSFFKLIFFLYNAFSGLFVVTELVDLYYISSDVQLILFNLKITTMAFICVLKAWSFIYWQNEWMQIIDYVTTTETMDRKTDDPSEKVIITKYTKYCHRMTYCYWMFTAPVYFITLIPVAKNLYFYVKYRNTDYFQPMFSSWFPFDKTRAPGCWVSLAVHVMAGTYGAVTMATYDVFVVVIMVFFGGRLDILRERCKRMLGKDGKDLDKDFNKRIRELHQTHIDIIKYAGLFDSLVSPVMFFYVIVCAMMLCANAYVINSAMNISHLIFGTTQLFIFCWHSNDVLWKFQGVRWGPYECQWWSANIKHRRSVLLLAGQLRMIKVFTAGPFTYLTVGTFITILKGAYSYYTLLRD